MSTAIFTTATTATTGTTTTQDRTAGRVSWKRGLATGAVASVVVTAVAGAFQAAGQTLSVDGGPIPLLSYVQMILLSTVVGIVVARHTSRTTFYRVAVALTVLSIVPDLAWGEGFVSTTGLILTHVVAAAIVIPRLARR
jgi:hypothetical protein